MLPREALVAGTDHAFVKLTLMRIIELATRDQVMQAVRALSLLELLLASSTKQFVALCFVWYAYARTPFRR